MNELQKIARQRKQIARAYKKSIDHIEKIGLHHDIHKIMAYEWCNEYTTVLIITSLNGMDYKEYLITYDHKENTIKVIDEKTI